MYVTQHAASRLDERLDWGTSNDLQVKLEGVAGEPGTVAYIAAVLDTPVRADDGSNGDLIVVIAVDGSVETVYFRRSTQDMSPEFFGAAKVVKL